MAPGVLLERFLFAQAPLFAQNALVGKTKINVQEIKDQSAWENSNSVHYDVYKPVT